MYKVSVLFLLLFSYTWAAYANQNAVDSVETDRKTKLLIAPDAVYFGLSSQFRAPNGTSTSDWFEQQGLGSADFRQFYDFLLGGYMGDAGIFELRFSIQGNPSSVSSSQFALGLLAPIWQRRRMGLHVGASISFQMHNVFGITEYVPPALRADTVDRNISPDLLELRQFGFGITPELRYVYHIGKNDKFGPTLFASAGLNMHAMMRWRFRYDTGGILLQLSRPPIPSSSSIVPFARLGITFRFPSLGENSGT